MSNSCAVPVILMSSVFLISCSSNNDEVLAPLLADAQTPVTTEIPSVVEPFIDIEAPEFKGNLDFANTVTIELDALLDGSNLRTAYSGVMARDGLTVNVPVKDERGYNKAYIQINVGNGEAGWAFSELSDDTRILFDANNQPIAALAIGCGTVSYVSHQDLTLFDMTNLLPAGKCFTADQTVSASGEVVVVGTYADITGNPFLNTTTKFHAYSLNTASWVDYPDLRLGVDGLTLQPIWPDSLFSTSGMSDDGKWMLTRQWWEGTESFGETRRQVGAVLWNTLSGDWQTLGLIADQRSCIGTSKVSCKPPYNYVMSSDGWTQFVQVPTSERIELGSGPLVKFATNTVKTASSQPSATLVPGLLNTTSLTVDNTGSHLVFFATENSELPSKGYTLYNDVTGQFSSLNRALNTCSSVDSDDSVVAESDCLYASVPVTTTSNATTFTADGSKLLLRSISRSTDSNQQQVDDFMLDVAQGRVYTIPAPFSGDPLSVSGNGSVMLGVTGYPDYDFVIGTRD